MSKVVIANWKMSLQVKQALALAEKFRHIKSKHQVIVCPSFVHISMCKEVATNMQLGAQNCSEHDLGAQTGQVAAAQLFELGVRYCLVGHSEARASGETCEQVATKAAKAAAAGMLPVVCIGESLDEKKAGQTDAVLSAQLAPVIKVGLKKFWVAYEPIWAIGTGLAAQSADVQAIHQSIRKQLVSSAKLDSDPKILYGGSVKPANSAELLALPDVDGLLVGGASLDVEQFSQICEN